MIDDWKSVRKVTFFSDNTFYVLPPNHLEILRILKMLQYLYDEEAKNFFSSDEEIIDMMDRSIGFMTRIIAYVMIVTGLENIFYQTYKYTEWFMKKYGFGDVLPPKKRINKFRNDLEKFFIYRNKIFAHTSYAKPFEYEPIKSRIVDLYRKLTGHSVSRKREDSPSTQHTSLGYFAGTMLNKQEKSFALGNYYMVTEGGDPINLPYLDIATDHKMIVDHFSAWIKIFSEIITKLEKKDIDSIKKKSVFKDIIFQN